MPSRSKKKAIHIIVHKFRESRHKSPASCHFTRSASYGPAWARIHRNQVALPRKMLGKSSPTLVRHMAYLFNDITVEIPALRQLDIARKVN